MPRPKDNPLADLLRKRSLKVTRLRLAILAILQKAKSPVGAPEIIAAAKEDGANYVTVYRAIAALEKSLIIRRVNLRHNHADYELQDEKDHHHIICKTCGKIESFENCQVDDLAKSILAKSKSFATIDDHALEFFGQCTTCGKKPLKTASRAKQPR
jgi:Fe2+ or Zn2+ uptake regulation protein